MCICLACCKFDELETCWFTANQSQHTGIALGTRLIVKTKWFELIIAVYKVFENEFKYFRKRLTNVEILPGRGGGPIMMS